MQAYSKRSDLADTLVSAVQQLRRAQAEPGEATFSVRSTQSPRQWRVSDMLSEADTGRLIAAFTTGTSKRMLAERYGISESSVKRLIRQHRVSKPSSGLSEHQRLRLAGRKDDLRQSIAAPDLHWGRGQNVALLIVNIVLQIVSTAHPHAVLPGDDRIVSVYQPRCLLL